MLFVRMSLTRYHPLEYLTTTKSGVNGNRRERADDQEPVREKDDASVAKKAFVLP